MRVPHPPRRIVSIVPSQTELLADLGLAEEVVGITKFCVHPAEWFAVKSRVGGTKQLKMEMLTSLEPDLVIANKEENVKEDIVRIETFAPVWVSDVKDLSSALDMIRSIGRITDRFQPASRLAEDIFQRFAALEKKIAGEQRLRVVYLIWKNPLMAAGKDTFIDHMLARCGFENAMTEERYPTLDKAQLHELGPDLVLLSSEPFPFRGKHTEELIRQFPELDFLEVDGELFSWYGSRLRQSPGYFEALRKQLTIDHSSQS